MSNQDQGIIKYFSDPEMAQSYAEIREDQPNNRRPSWDHIGAAIISDHELEKCQWFWGLGADGELYIKCSLFDDPNFWYDSSDCPIAISFRDYCRIVNTFQHLLAFL